MKASPIAAILALLTLGAIIWLILQGQPSDSSIDPDLKEEERLELVATWNRSNLAMDQFKFSDAAAGYQKVVDRIPHQADAWVNLAIAVMNQDSSEAFNDANSHLRKALELDPKHLQANHCHGVLLRHLGENEEAEVRFRTVLELDPHDPAAHYYLATLLMTRKNFSEAEKHLKASIAEEPHQASAIKNLFSLYYRQGNEEAATPLVELFQEFQSKEVGNLAGIVYSEMGRYGSVIVPFPIPGPRDARDAPRLSLTPRSIIGGEPDSSPGQFTAKTITVAANVPLVDALTETFVKSFGPGMAIADVNNDGQLDLWMADGTSAGNLFLNDGGTFQDVTEAWGLNVAGTKSISACFGDLNNDGHQDLYVCCAGPNLLFMNEGKRFIDATAQSRTGGGMNLSSQAVMADLDADGDLDIFVGQLADLTQDARESETTWPVDYPSPACQLFNNNRDGTYTDIAETCGASLQGHGTSAILCADFDSDHDADLLVLSLTKPARLLRNDRLWRFVDRTDASGLPDAPLRGGIVSDMNQDQSTDLALLSTSDDLHLLRQVSPLKFAADGHSRSDITNLALLDGDNSGHEELLLLSEDSSSLHPVGTDGESVPIDLSSVPASTIRCLLPADVDNDGRLDLLASRSGADPLVLINTTESVGQWIAIDLKGVREDGKMRTNTGGVGARIKTISGSHQQMREVLTGSGVLGGASQRAHFGLGQATQVDHLSIIWPDDLLQGEGQLSAGQVKTITQTYRKSSSCPLLFAWDGERMAFITDFLGVGGLGFFIAPGQYAPPDPTELVAIPTLVPRDDRYVLSIHEPMEEILYLDHAELLVVDHPEGCRVYPDERLALNGEAPNGRLIAIYETERFFPEALVTLEGAADPTRLHEVDRRYQPGVHPNRSFLGYAKEQHIILDFQAALGDEGRKDLVLFIQGWVEYPYSHVNFAAWQAGLALHGLSLDWETSDGAWEVFVEDFGYPAGMPRMMTFDISKLPRHGTGRLRLRTNIELYLDQVFLAEDQGMESAQVHRLQASRADLRPSGYPREYSPDGHEPLLYDYALMDSAIDFKTMSGNYTRFGDVRPLLETADDRYVVMGRAEEILLEFPVVKDSGESSTRRSFILDSTGWCKDMDLYTAYPHTVGPLPYLGMGDYPPAPADRRDHRSATQDWIRQWNTRKLKGHASRAGR